jgi:signal transduction histidine kinase
VADAQWTAEQLDRQLDFFVGDLRPAALDDLGLETALSQFVREWSQNFGIRAEFHAAGLNGRMDREVETHLYRISQEALNNVYKHADAQSVAVLLERRDSQLVLIIEDDGTGFQPERSDTKHKGLGLVGMQERAALIGGLMEIETAPGQGTAVYLQVPLGSPSTPEIKQSDAVPGRGLLFAKPGSSTPEQTPAGRRTRKKRD